MTIDERLNDLEDQIRKIKEAINSNNNVARQISSSLQKSIASLQLSIEQIKTQSTATNVNMGDIFGGNFGGSK